MTERSAANDSITSPDNRTGEASLTISVRLLVVTVLATAVLAFAVGRLAQQGPADVRTALEEARTELLLQQRAVDRLRTQQDRDERAAAARLAELQATATRLDALGGRIVEVAGLDDGEFDFDAFAPVGGPEETLGDMPLASIEIDDALASLSSRLRRQSAQLATLEELLVGRQIESARKPAGWPISGGWISSGFGERADPFTGNRAWHNGVDVTGPRGSDVLSVAGGVVIFAGRRDGYGYTVDVDHGNGYLTRYAHNAELYVDAGDRVQPRQAVGRMGRTGRSTGAHVHFEVHREGRPVNPYRFIREMN